ncbi:flagellar biosynthesis protein FlgL [Epibacterium sp. DP7N7-1]|uniref:flagellin n=1 Tax=Tritonibacter mobilis TaxID=379347 RepID=UPI000806BA2A|nr:flagellin [Tritonibacter mobilis]MBW3242062.1 flagellar biosynthesis protein FlgL [Epibacterium sp. DP7N7-1]GLP87246.1 flagellar hook protein FlgL [Tritonibacter mobilis]SDW43634.1 flagellar hook-associated protein 3 FlgL [Tritonibacter mobilis]
MNVQSFGDMAQYLFLRRRSVELNKTLDTLTQEMSTGIASNLPERLGGDLGFVVDLERSISKMDSYKVAAQEAGLFASTAQSYLERINDNALNLGSDILALSSTSNDTTTQEMATQSANFLTETIANLNGKLSGRSLFAGTDTSSTPLESADTMMTALIAEVGALTDVDDIVQAVENWFNDPAGFDAIMYNGSTNNMSAVRIGANEEVNFALRADDDRLKQAMQSFALGALASSDNLSHLSTVESSALIKRAGTELMNAQSELTDVQSDLGFIQARIEETQTRNTAALTSMGTTLNDLILADPAETASRVEEVQFQLEALYSITVRSSQLNLLNYM